MRIVITILICLLGIIISVYDIKSQNIPVLFLGLHLASIIIYISLYSMTTGIILGISELTLFVVCMITQTNIDWLYVELICIGLILLKITELFKPIMLLPILICALVVIFSKLKKFPYMVCLTAIISLTLLQLI